MEESRPVDRRGMPHGLTQGLIAYGIIGLVVASVGFGAMVWVNARISDVRGEAEATVARLGNTMELAATVLRGASTTAQSFSGTVDQAAQAVSTAAVATTELKTELSALEAQLRSVNFLGATPLSASADAVGRIGASIDGLDAQLSLAAGDLKGNRDALKGSATSIGKLADSAAALAAHLGPSVGQDSLGNVQEVIAVTLLMFAAWSFVPAAAALMLGLWLRREEGRSLPV